MKMDNVAPSLRDTPDAALPATRGGEAEAHCPGFGPGWKCDGKWHRGWDGHDPYCERCPDWRPNGRRSDGR